MNLTLKNEIVKLNIKKLECQVRVTLIELENFMNQSMPSTLFFKNIREHRETWENSASKLNQFYPFLWRSKLILLLLKLALLTIKINMERNASKIPLYNLKTLTFSPPNSILLQFLPLNIKLLINKFLIEKSQKQRK